MALIQNRKQVYEAQIKDLREKKAMIEQTLEALGGKTQHNFFFR